MKWGTFWGIPGVQATLKTCFDMFWHVIAKQSVAHTFRHTYYIYILFIYIYQVCLWLRNFIAMDAVLGSWMMPNVWSFVAAFRMIYVLDWHRYSMSMVDASWLVVRVKRLRWSEMGWTVVRCGEHQLWELKGITDKLQDIWELCYDESCRKEQMSSHVWRMTDVSFWSDKLTWYSGLLTWLDDLVPDSIHYSPVFTSPHWCGRMFSPLPFKKPNMTRRCHGRSRWLWWTFGRQSHVARFVWGLRGGFSGGLKNIFRRANGFRYQQSVRL